MLIRDWWYGSGCFACPETGLTEREYFYLVEGDGWWACNYPVYRLYIMGWRLLKFLRIARRS